MLRALPYWLPHVISRLSHIGQVLDLAGAAEGIRTPDPRITNALLYQLSYRGFIGFFARPDRNCHPIATRRVTVRC
jgi:hypothetical protein